MPSATCCKRRWRNPHTGRCPARRLRMKAPSRHGSALKLLWLGARLRQIGVPTIIIEKNARPGDSWRNRYRSLVLHDPVWYDHLPYIPFPENWPVFTPKDKMGDWLEMYVRVMELNYWVATKCVSASYDEAEKVWTVVVDRVGRHITLKPKHIVFATGAYGPPRQIAL